MIRAFSALLAAVVIIGATAHLTSARAPVAVPVKDRGSAFDHFERLLPLVKEGSEEVTEALTKGKSVWLTIAAVEAVRQAEVDKRGTGRPYFTDVLALMGEKHKKHHSEELLPVNVMACLGVLARNDEAATLQVVRTLIEWQKWSENEIVRLRHMADRILFDLTGEDCAFNQDTLTFWEWWLRNKELQQNTDDADRPPEKRSKTAPIIFKEPMVGTRVVFVIDVSDSMKWSIVDADLPRIKRATDHLDWVNMPDPPSPMDLAKAELAYSIDKLRPDKDDGKKKRRSTKKDPEMRHFAIVTYSTEVKMFTDGWVEATDRNCDTWMGEVDDLDTEHMTNIHGALLEAFQLSEKKGKSKKPDELALDKDCVLTGAHTIVFLTDGYATWSDDSKEQTGTDEWGRENKIGDGEYVKRDKLVELERRLNRFRKVVINTVGIGIHDKDLMKAFSKATGGGYTDWGCKVDYGQGG